VSSITNNNEGIAMTKYEFVQSKSWSVWVGGGEVNDHYLTLQEAQDLANSYERGGYTDVSVRQEK
jgi:hypothetical protein